MHVIKYNFLN